MITAPDFITQYITGMTSSPDIVVVGAGGTGSALLGKLFMLNNTLVALGAEPLSVSVYDPDTVSPSNIGRQAFYEFDIGRNKAEVLVSRFNAFGTVNWTSHNEAYSCYDKYYSPVIIIGCVDSVDGRKAMHESMKELNNALYIDCGNDSTSGNVIMGMNAYVNSTRCYLPSVVDLYKEQFATHQPRPSDSCSAEEAINKQEFGVNDTAANHAIQLLWQLFRHGKVAHQGISYDLKSGYSVPIEATPETWAMYGYAECA